MAKVSGGEKAQAELDKIAAGLTSASTLRVGFLEGATNRDGGSIPMIAAIHNYGAPAAGILPRPFFSNMIADNWSTWAPALRVSLKNQNMDAAKGLAELGELIRGQLQKAINDFAGVPLKPATIARKGFDKQLVEWGDMLNSVDKEVE